MSTGIEVTKCTVLTTKATLTLSVPAAALHGVLTDDDEVLGDIMNAIAAALRNGVAAKSSADEEEGTPA